MDVLVEIEDEILLKLLLSAERYGQSLNEEILDILDPLFSPGRAYHPLIHAI